MGMYYIKEGKRYEVNHNSGRSRRRYCFNSIDIGRLFGVGERRIRALQREGKLDCSDLKAICDLYVAYKKAEGGAFYDYLEDK